MTPHFLLDSLLSKKKRLDQMAGRRASEIVMDEQGVHVMLGEGVDDRPVLTSAVLRYQNGVVLFAPPAVIPIIRAASRRALLSNGAHV